MKVLIVEDEKHVIKAINYFIKWEEYEIDTVLEAYDGEEAISIIKETSPDIIFTDMKMPKKDGIELLSWIQINHKTAKIIAISSYSNYDYLRQVIKSGGIDYILKPIDPSLLKEALSKAIKQLKTENQIKERNIKVNMYTPIYWEKSLSDLILSPQSHQEYLNNVVNEFKIHNKPLIICIITIPESVTIAKSLFNNDMNLLFFSINNICNEIITKESGYSFKYLHSKDEIVILYWGDTELIDKKLINIREWIYRLCNSMPIISKGTRISTIYDLNFGYKSAKKAYQNRNLKNDYKSKICSYQNDLHYIDCYSLLSSYYDDLILHTKSLNKDGLKKIIENIYNDFYYYPYITVFDLENLQSSYKRLRENAIIVLFEKLATSIKHFQEVNHFSISDVFDNISEDLFYIFNEYSKDKRKNNLVDDVINYIQLHYTENISLSTLSEVFFVSKEHLSRAFKKKVGKNISDYITDIKIEKAAYLLLNSNKSIKIISESLGYKDEKYFSKVFKKYYNLSPNQFRKEK